MTHKDYLSGEDNANIRVRDGDWGLWVSSAGSSTCIRHFGCQEENSDGNCACGGKCYNCKLDAPEAMVGFRDMVVWKR